MIARSPLNAEPLNWSDELSRAYTSPVELLRDLGLDPASAGFAPPAARLFHFRVPRPFVNRMQRCNPRDPLLLQVLPREGELVNVPGFGSDPVADDLAVRVPGLLQKYHGRALLILTGGCAVHCRYCFRREYPYQGAVGSDKLTAAIEVIAHDTSLAEVILSGGDPLTLRDAALAQLINRLAAIPHVRRLRVHTRLPVVLPSRVTSPLVAALTGTRLPAVMVVHVNHPHEIDRDVRAACLALRDAGVALLNQTVLLRGINDCAETLIALSEKMFEARILPYYLHQLDRVTGASHFEVDDVSARNLYTEMRRRLPGYLVPRFVREIAGAESKTPFL